MLSKQRELVSIINKIRREYHNDLRNQGKLNPGFNIGDLVVVRKQMRSDQARGISAKLVFRTKGPYRVLEKVSERSFGRKGVIRK